MSDDCVVFQAVDETHWITTILQSLDRLSLSKKAKKGRTVQIVIDKDVKKSDLTPVHMVLLACFFESLERLNYNDLWACIENRDLSDFLFKDLQLAAYFSDDNRIAHYDAPDKHIHNLWKIEAGKEKGYSDSVSAYFRRNYFQGKDISAFQNALDEVYLNIADHAEAAGVAFSYVSYDEEQQRIHVAVCDFGLGIPTTLKAKYPTKYFNDQEALRDALEFGISAQTHTHNRGFGLDNVVSSLSGCDCLKIVSNKAELRCAANKNPISIFPLNFDFTGTLVYFEVSIDSFPLEEDTLNDVIIG